jgi:hypothetical protein
VVLAASTLLVVPSERVVASDEVPWVDPVTQALDAVRRVVPLHLLAEFEEFLPRTTEDATPRLLTALPMEQQSIILQSACTALSNGVVTFTCEDELEYVNGLQTPIELVHQLVEATNASLRGPDPAQSTLDYSGVGQLASQETLDTVIASAAPPPAGDFDESEFRSLDLYPIGVEVILPNGRRLFPDPFGLGARYKCGWFARPKPRRAATAVRTGWLASSSTQAGADANARAWARSQGFHDTPGFAGGGMTRSQSYSFCGWGTYRDHAWPDITQLRTGNAPPYTYQARLLIQDYTSAPYGEPNPEVWRTGPWPYGEWPVYVNWWHRTR